MENLELTKKNILQIGYNKKFAFLKIEENKDIILKILPKILENLEIKLCRTLEDEKFEDFVLDFDAQLTPQQEKNLARLEIIIQNLNDFLEENKWNNIIIQDYLKYIFGTRTLN